MCMVLSSLSCSWLSVVEFDCKRCHFKVFLVFFAVIVFWLLGVQLSVSLPLLIERLLSEVILSCVQSTFNSTLLFKADNGDLLSGTKSRPRFGTMSCHDLDQGQSFLA